MILSSNASRYLIVILFMFLIGAIIGYGLEVFYRRFFSAKKWVNPGFMKGPYLPLYGFGLVLMFGILGLGDAKMADGIIPIAVGLLILVIGVSLGGPTGYAINPARDFSPRLAHFLLPMKNKGGSDWAYAWIPIVGPILGAIAGAMVYTNIF